MDAVSLLQLGMFKHPRDAEVCCSNMKQAGIAAKVKALKPGGTVPALQVYIGPVQGEDQLAALRQTLSEQNIGFMEIRLR